MEIKLFDVQCKKKKKDAFNFFCCCCCFFTVREISLDSIQAPEPRTREEFLQCKSVQNDRSTHKLGPQTVTF